MSPARCGTNAMPIDRSLSILVVDDDDGGRYLKTRLLERAGYLVIEADSGQRALDIVRDRNPALVLLDVKLPDISGIEVSRLIKADYPGVLVLQTSAAFTSTQDRAGGLAGGADSYLVEPIEPDELIATVQALLRLHSAEQELRRTNETLESKVMARTREIADINIRLTEEMRQRVEAEDIIRHTQKLDILGQLTGGMAHDFNNMLTIVIGNLETLQRQLQGPDADLDRVRRSAENAFKGAKRAAAITQRLLAFSRRQALTPEPVDIGRLIDSMSDLLRQTLGDDIVLRIDRGEAPWLSNVDPNQLESAILNLALNARDAMPDGGQIVIGTENIVLDEGQAAQVGVAAGSYVVLGVADSGIGMARSVIDLVFEPFFTTKDVGHGTGLGLSQVYGFVTQSSGQVRIYSEIGEGTTVRIYLPRLFADHEQIQIAEHVPAAPRGDLSQAILVVEDDPDVRAHSIEVLTDLGYRVLDAASGKAALQVLDRERGIALLFTDIGLPGGMNGRQLAIEALQRQPRIRVLFATGYGRSTVIDDGQFDPQTQLITKPFSHAMLATRIRDLLREEKPVSRLLLVEDEALIRMVTTDALMSLGFEVEEAGSAAEAIRKFQEIEAIGGAIVDLGLPDRKGDVLVGELRALRADLPVIIASGYGGDTLKARFAGQNLIGFLTKPYQIEALETALRAVGIVAPAGALS